YKLLSSDEATNAVPAIKEIGMLSFFQHLPALTPENAADLVERLQQDDVWTGLVAISKCFVCLKDDEIIGMVHLVPSGNPWDIFKPEWCYLRMVGVNPKYQ